MLEAAGGGWRKEVVMHHGFVFVVMPRNTFDPSFPLPNLGPQPTPSLLANFFYSCFKFQVKCHLLYKATLNFPWMLVASFSVLKQVIFLFIHSVNIDWASMMFQALFKVLGIQ